MNNQYSNTQSPMYGNPNAGSTQDFLNYYNQWTQGQVNGATNQLAADNNSGSGNQAQDESALEAAQARQAIYNGMNTNTAQSVNFASGPNGYGEGGYYTGVEGFADPNVHLQRNSMGSASAPSGNGYAGGYASYSGGGGGGGGEGPQSQSAPSTETFGPPVTLNNPQGQVGQGNAGNSVSNYGGAASSYSPAVARVNPAQMDELGGEIVGQSPSSYQQGPFTNIQGVPGGTPGTYGQPDSGSYTSYSGVTPVNLLGPFAQVSPDNANSTTQGQLDSIYGYTPATYGPPTSLNSNNTYVNPYVSNSIFDTGADDGE